MREIAEPADDDLSLVDRCKRGDPAAWRALFDGHFDYVRRVARRLGTPESELDDICQETFLVVHRRLEQFEGGRFRSWVYRICANVSSDRHRKRRRRETFGELLGRREPDAAPRTPYTDVEQAEAARMVSEVLSRMKPKKREVFALYELEGLSGQEIAELVDCKIDTVWARLHHARKEFAHIAKKRGWIHE